MPVEVAPAVVFTEVTPALAPAPALLVVDEVESVKAEIQRLDNAEAEKAYFLSLPAAIKAKPELQAWLKERKAQREAAANIDELF